MDILNWVYLLKKKLIKDKVENPDQDLLVIGGKATYAKRGDAYQSYGVPFGSAVAELEGNVLRTGIYDETTNGGDYWFGISPILTKTTDKVIDTPASPTFVSVDMQGWKLSGSFDISNTNYAGDQVYLGSIEFNIDLPFWDMFPWKTSGQVYSWDGSDCYSALGYGSLMYEVNAGGLIPVNTYIKLQWYPTSAGSGYDIYLVYDQADPTAQITYSVVSFQFEFLTPTEQIPTYYFY